VTRTIQILALVLLAGRAAAETPSAPAAAAAAQPAGAPAVAANPPADSTAVFGDQSLPPTLRENVYFYQSFGTTDPFRSPLSGDFEPKLQDLVDLHTVKMVGVLWEPDDIAAILQDGQGFGYTLRPGDSVKNGSVVSVTQDALVARLNIFGQTTQFTLRLQHGE
jgi:hypothetical protein